MGQLRCSRSELARQAAQKVCPQAMVSGRRKSVMQMGHTSSYIYYSIRLVIKYRQGSQAIIRSDIFGSCPKLVAMEYEIRQTAACIAPYTYLWRQDIHYNIMSSSSPPRRSPQAQEKPKLNKIFVTNLDAEVPSGKLQAELQQKFSKFAKLQSVTVKKSFNNEYSFAFIEYYEGQDASAAVKELSNTLIFGKRMKVELQDDSRRRKGSNETCFVCGKAGHYARNCRQNIDRQERERSRSSSDSRRHRHRHSKKHRRSRSRSSSKGRRSRKDKKKKERKIKKEKHRKSRRGSDSPR